MPHPLERKITRLRGRMRCLVTAYGLSAAVTGVLAALILLGLLDYLLRFQDQGLRIFASLAFWGTLAWTFYRFIYLPATVRISNLDLAVKLQRHFPQLDERLASAVEFITQDEDDITAGSPALRRSVIAQTATEIEHLDFNQILDTRPVRRVLLLCGTVCLAAIILVILDHSASLTAVARLLNPLNHIAWPQQLDREGLTNRTNDRWDIIAVADNPPSITIEQPTDTTYVTPQAVVPLRIMAKDDLAIRDVTLAYSKQTTAESTMDSTVGLPSSAPQETIVPLYTGPQQLAPQSIDNPA